MTINLRVFASRRMLLAIHVIVMFASLSGVYALDDKNEFGVPCPDSDVCSCTDEVVECICPNATDKFKYDSTDETFSKTLKSFSFRNCTLLKISAEWLAFYDRLENVSIHNVRALILDLGDFKKWGLQNLVIENVRSAKIANWTFIHHLKLLRFENSSLRDVAEKEPAELFVSNVDKVIIKKCFVPFRVMSFRNVGQLTLDGPDLQAGRKCDKFVIENVNSASVYCLFSAVDSITIENSNIYRIGLSVINVRYLFVNNCTFDALRPGSIEPLHVQEKFQIINSTVDTIWGKAFHIISSDEVLFQSTNFRRTVADSPRAMAITTNKFTISNCTFDWSVDTSVFFNRHDAKQFRFENNTVMRLEKDTFRYHESGLLTFKNNRIFEAEPNFFDVPFGRRMSKDVDIRDNWISCSRSSVRWMWENKTIYSMPLLDNSKCLGPKYLEGATLKCLVVEELPFELPIQYFSNGSYDLSDAEEEKVKFREDCDEFGNPLSKETADVRTTSVYDVLVEDKTISQDDSVPLKSSLGILMGSFVLYSVIHF